jgi:hypothetical protein
LEIPSDPTPISDPPKPGGLLIVNSLAVIAICLALFGLSLWILVTKYTPLLALGAPLMLCVPLLIAAMQYRAVFRQSEIAARNAGKYLFIAGGLLAIFFAMMTYIYATNEKDVDLQRVLLSIALVAGSLYLLYCGRCDQRWAKQLEASDPDSTEA